MTYDVIFSDTAFRQLKRMERPAQERIIATLERMRVRPGRFVTKLVGDPAYKVRVGDWRIIMDIDREGHRILILT